MAERRVALVVGNGGYSPHAPALDNPPNDATAMAALCRAAGFEVFEGVDADLDAFDALQTAFLAKAGDADLALFFFAGHGLQVDGENYLVPVRAALEHEGQLDRKTVRLDGLQAAMANRARASVLFLDCCRDNPFARSLRPAPGRARRSVQPARGLAAMEERDGVLIGFATSPNEVASDGTGENSPYTTALLAALRQPGISLTDALTDVARMVDDATGGVQAPWFHSSLRNRIHFAPAADTRPAVAGLPDTRPPDGAADVRPTAVLQPAAPPADVSNGLLATPDGRTPEPGRDAGATARGARSSRAWLSFAALGVIAAAGLAGWQVWPRPQTAADIIRYIDDPEAERQPAPDLAGFLLAARTGDQRAVVEAIVGRLQSAVIEASPGETIPENCRAPTQPRSDEPVTLVCAGVDRHAEYRLLGMLADAPIVWNDPAWAEQGKRARLAVADVIGRETLWRSFPKRGNIEAALGLPRAASPLVTLQFSGDFRRGNAQAVADRLSALGWRIDGVQRSGNGTDNEVRHSGSGAAVEGAEALSRDLAVMGLAGEPVRSPALNSDRQLDIYLSKPLPLWNAAPPRLAWCTAPTSAAPRQVTHCAISRAECEVRREGAAHRDACRFTALKPGGAWQYRDGDYIRDGFLGIWSLTGG